MIEKLQQAAMEVDSDQEKSTGWEILSPENNDIDFDPERAERYSNQVKSELDAKTEKSDQGSYPDVSHLPSDTSELFINQMVRIHDDVTSAPTQAWLANQYQGNSYYAMADQVKVKQNLMQTFDYSGGQLRPTPELDRVIQDYENKLEEARNSQDAEKIAVYESEVSMRREARELLSGGQELYNMFDKQASELIAEGDVFARQQQEEHERILRQERAANVISEKLRERAEALVEQLSPAEIAKLQEQTINHVDRKEMDEFIEEKIKEISPAVFEHINQEYQRNPAEAHEVVISELTEALGLENVLGREIWRRPRMCLSF